MRDETGALSGKPEGFRRAGMPTASALRLPFAAAGVFSAGTAPL